MSKLRLTTWPVETIDATEARTSGGEPSSGRVECVICGKTYVASAIVLDDIRTTNAGGGAMSVGRCRLYCDHCHKVIEWRAEAWEGLPTRNVYGGHQVIADPVKVRAFLAEHPEAAGVEQR